MKVNVVGKEFSEVELAYLAGFIDADGAIMATIEKHQEKKFGFRVRITVKITQRDVCILEYFLQQFQVGYVRKNRTTFDWLIRSQKDVKVILNLLKPYLKSKSKQAVLAETILNIEIVSQDDLVEAANLADSLSRFNVRSQGRRKNYVSMIQESFSRND